MNSEIWFPGDFQISEYCSRHGFSMKTVSGLTNNGFGVHEHKGVWRITHLKSGWRCFACNSEEGAIVIGNYLVRNYAVNFDVVIASGAQIENAVLLRRKIRVDQQLNALLDRFAFAESELRKRNLIPDVRVEFIS